MKKHTKGDAARVWHPGRQGVSFVDCAGERRTMFFGGVNVSRIADTALFCGGWEGNYETQQRMARGV